MSGMENSESGVRVLSRGQAITKLRNHLVSLTDDDHSICAVAARKGIFCHGFARWNDAELRKRFAGLVKLRPDVNRWQLENLGNTWELARQVVNRVSLACDAQTVEHDTCRGWDEFSNDELARFCSELLGLNCAVTETGDETAPAVASSGQI